MWRRWGEGQAEQAPIGDDQTVSPLWDRSGGCELY